MSGPVVVGYDGSDCAQEALRVAADLARATGDRLVVAFAFGVAPMAEAADHRELLRQAGAELVEEARGRLDGAGVEVEERVVDGRPADGLVQVAEELGARMIVVGTHGEAPLAGALLGSVPHKLLHRSTLPVLVVPAAG